MTDEAVPPMFDFYTRFYDAVVGSAANAEYCARVYGRNLCQHGFADLAHLDHLISRPAGWAPAAACSTWAAATA